MPSSPVSNDHPTQKVERELLLSWPLPMPGEDGDKEERGRVLIVGGSLEIPGAVVLAANAALRSGAGKVSVATDARVALPLALAVPELRVVPLPPAADGGFDPVGADILKPLAERADAILLGPGMQGSQSSASLVQRLLQGLGPAKVILDALAMDAVAELPGRDPETRLMLTPHAGEMAHLTGLTREEVCADPQALARAWSTRWDAVLAVKGATTVIASPSGRLLLHEAGNPGLAVSGSGDCLAGITAALLARGAEPLQALCWGVFLHSRAGARLAERTGTLGFLAREIPDQLPALLDELAP